MWCVVESNEEGSKFVIAVPSSWIINNNILLWPPKNVSTFAARKHCFTPLQTQYECRILQHDIGKYYQFL